MMIREVSLMIVQVVVFFAQFLVLSHLPLLNIFTKVSFVRSCENLMIETMKSFFFIEVFGFH